MKLTNSQKNTHIALKTNILLFSINVLWNGARSPTLLTFQLLPVSPPPLKQAVLGAKQHIVGDLVPPVRPLGWLQVVLVLIKVVREAVLVINERGVRQSFRVLVIQVGLPRGRVEGASLEVHPIQVELWKEWEILGNISWSKWLIAEDRFRPLVPKTDKSSRSL